MTKANKIRRYITKHPEALNGTIAKKFEVTPGYVSLLRSKLAAEATEEAVEVLADALPKEKNWVVSYVSTSNKSIKDTPNKVIPAATDVDATLAERGKRYGSFKGHAEVTMGLKRQIADALFTRNKTLLSDQQEALDMICHKIGRIVNGDPDSLS